MTMQNSLWVEKFRPKKIEEIKGHDQITDRLEGYVGDGETPHMLFSGPPGTGKTAAVVAFARETYGDNWSQNIMEMNASDERGIDTIRDKVKSFARTAPTGGADFQMIFLDESDSLCLPANEKVVVGYPSSKEVKPISEVSGDGEPIPSIDFETNEIQSDKGRMIETGTADFYNLTLSNGKQVVASPKHPFFTVTDSNELFETQLRDLSAGDEIADMQNDIGVSQCDYCSEWTGNSRFCSVSCKDSGHSDEMTGESNSPRPNPQTDGGRKSVDTVTVESIEFDHRGKAYNITMEGTPNFMMANGVLTHNTDDAQASLRRVMEEYSDVTRFFLSCNYPNQIIPAIQSRCSVFRFSRLTDDDIRGILKHVVAQEGLDAEPEAIDQIVSSCKGDARSAINSLQSSSTNGSVTSESVSVSVGVVDSGVCEEIVQKAISGKPDEAMAQLDTDLLKEGANTNVMADEFLRILKRSEIHGPAKAKAMSKLADCDWRVRQGSNPNVQWHGFLADLTVVRNLDYSKYGDGQ